MKLSDLDAAEQSALLALEKRIGRAHLRQRLGLEGEHETHVFRRGTHFFHLENWYSIHAFIRTGLTAAAATRCASNCASTRCRSPACPAPSTATPCCI